MIVIAVLIGTMGLFLWGRWRHDMVALAALLAVVIAGLVPAGDAFDGFGHPAVITVACVLVLSHGLQHSGAVDLLARAVLPAEAGAFLTIAAITSLAALLSGFMNNVGALALLMPLAIQLANRLELSPGQVLMPLSFGSILGGMTTMIGTPPNLVVAGFRAETRGAAFGMFDFTPVGLAVALAGIAFILTAGRFLVPARERADAEAFEIGAYLTEARVGQDSPVAGQTLREAEQALEAADAQVVGLVRNDVRLSGPNPTRRVRGGDILVIEADPEALAKVLSTLDLRLVEDHAENDEGDDDDKGDAKAEGKTEGNDAAAAAAKPTPAARLAARALRQPGKGKAADGANDNEKKGAENDEVVLMELAVLPDSTIIGRTANAIGLRLRYGINLLAVSRHGRRTIARLRSVEFHAGDVLLLQGSPEAIAEFGAHSGCLPLAERKLRLPNRRAAYTAGGIMAATILTVAAGLLPAAVAFAGGVLAVMVTRVVQPRNVYQAIDWPVIVLLGALLAVADAMEATGTADLVAWFLLDSIAQGNAVAALVVLLVATMLLTDFMNNAATVAVLCPIALSAAQGLGVNPDAFLMAVAIGGSCAFLTPIGHQNNTLILGPGGFRFGDYWRLGAPLQLVIIAAAVPMILVVWPL